MLFVFIVIVKLLVFLYIFVCFVKLLFKFNYKIYMYDKMNNNLVVIFFIIRKMDFVNFFVLFFIICL